MAHCRMPTSQPPVRPRRRLSVLVTDLAIGDGEVAPPQVGDIGRYALLFTETPPDETDPSIVTVTVDVEPLDDGVPLFQPAATAGFRDEERWREWRLFLRGDGWTATWYSRRPLLGRQRLTGRIIGDLGYATTGSFTGRILRAQIVSDTYRLAEQSSSEPARPPRWVPVPGTRRFQDLAAATGVFRDDTRPSDTWRRPDQRKRGLDDRDLDDVPPPPLRRRSSRPRCRRAADADSCGVGVAALQLVRHRAQAGIVTVVRLSTVVTVSSEHSAVAVEDDRAAFAGSRKNECLPPATFTAAANGLGSRASGLTA